MVSILDALQCAEINLENTKRVGIGILPFAQSQLSNALRLLEKGYDVYDEIDEIIEQYGSIENAPKKQ